MSTNTKRPKAPWCWQEKNNLRAIRALVKQSLIKKSEGRSMLDVFRAITEMISDSSGSEIVRGTNLAKRIGGYSLICPDNVRKTLTQMAGHGLIRMSKIRDASGRYLTTQIELMPPPQRRNPALDSHPGQSGIATKEKSGPGQNRTLIEKKFEFKEESFQSKKDVEVFEGELSPQDFVSQTSPLDDLGEGAVPAADLQKTQLIEVLAYFNRAAGHRHDPQRSTADHVLERLQEGASVEESLLVIDHRVSLWAKNPVMKNYIRPSTLFTRERFWEYLELAKRWNADGRPRQEQRPGQPDIAMLYPDGQVREELIEDWSDRVET